MGRNRPAIEAEVGLLSGPSEASQRLQTQIQRVAGTPRTTVLLRGAQAREAFLASRAIHAGSVDGGNGTLFRTAPCSQIGSAGSRTLDVMALLASTPSGTLFLGEVAHLGPDAQEELLSALESSPVGIHSSLPRVVASTAQDLEALVEAGEFREELLYRLNVLVVRVPALSERLEDLDTLTPAILRILGQNLGLVLSAAPDLCSSFNGYGWPGGLLELEAVLGRAAALALHGTPPSTQVSSEHLPPLGGDGPSDSLVPVPAGLESVQSLRAVEEATIRRVLAANDGNRSRAARCLGINRATLYNKLRLYGIA